MTKPTKWLCAQRKISLGIRPVWSEAKTQISLGIRPVWSESSLWAQWVAKDQSFFHVDSEDSDQTGRMPTLIWVFAGRTCHFVGFVMRRLNFHLSFIYSIWRDDVCDFFQFLSTFHVFAVWIPSSNFK